jgi:hypothetical protein
MNVRQEWDKHETKNILFDNNIDKDENDNWPTIATTRSRDSEVRSITTSTPSCAFGLLLFGSRRNAVHLIRVMYTLSTKFHSVTRFFLSGVTRWITVPRHHTIFFFVW